MIRDFASPAEMPIPKVDVCIIGAGIAGLTIANEFRDTSTSVIVLESGGRKDELATQQLYRSELAGLPHDGIHNGRFRVYGGSSTRWGAQLLTFDAHDFTKRPHVEYSGWPISIDELDPWYPAAERILNINDLSYESDLLAELGDPVLPFSENTFNYRFSKWAAFRHRNLAKTIGPACEKSRNITFLLHANVVELVPDPDSKAIDHVRIRSLDGRTDRVKARTFIICCGAIETCRLMLASNSVSSSGIGNDRDLVGRFFQDHISFRAAVLKPSNRKRFTHTFDPFYRGSTMHSCKLALSPQVQEQLGCLNVLGHVVYGFTEESGFYELRRILRAMQSKKSPIPSPIGAWRILRYSSDAFRMLFGQLLAKRRVSPALARCHLAVECEQAPSPDSRITLSTDTDVLGMPRSILDWRLGELERHTLRCYVGRFRENWEALELGSAEWSDSLDSPGDAWKSACQDTYHHAGGTRMHEDTALGVVDQNLRVHGLGNLYIGGTSVFPTSSCANPTLTMIALCLRLADRLKQRSAQV